ncbi:hypothetical protein [Sporosarcina sp. NCCP-2222]|nr:hypothetical protein [Sporosarcina sp. NCCP-2222]
MVTLSFIWINWRSDYYIGVPFGFFGVPGQYSNAAHQQAYTNRADLELQ